MNQPSDLITIQTLTNELWSRGDIYYPGQLRASQEILFKAWSECLHSETFLICAGRGWGKSHLLFFLCVLTALKFPNSDSVYVAPVQKKVKEFLEPIAKNVLKNCPSFLLPDFKESDLIYKFPNGSRILICGSNNQQFDSIRGGTYKFAAVDEGAYHDYLVELIEKVLRPALQKGRGKLLIASTPPDVQHPFDTYANDAEVGKYYFHATIYEAGYTADEIAKAKREAGWIEAENRWKTESHEFTWRIEYLAERGLRNLNRLVVPEWTEIYKRKSPRDLLKIPHYQFYKHYIGLDSGYRDFTAITFGTYYWKEGYFQFEGELQFIEKEVRSDLIIPKVIAMAKSLWGDTNWKPYYCIADSADPIFINELNKYELTFYGVEKKALRAMVNDFRVQVGASKIYVSEKCPYLLSNLKDAIWTKDGDKIDKDTFNHHFDHLMASIYLSRYINWNLNPIPNTFQVPTLPGTNVIPPWVQKRLDSNDPNAQAFSHLIKQQEKLTAPANVPPIKL